MKFDDFVGDFCRDYALEDVEADREYSDNASVFSEELAARTVMR